MKEKINKCIENKKSLWNYKFNSKVCGRTANLGGVGKNALAIKLKSSAKYPHLDIKAFISWSSYDDWTDEEKALAQELFNKLGL